MKTKKILFTIFSIVSLLYVFNSCKKEEDKPSVLPYLFRPVGVNVDLNKTQATISWYKVDSAVSYTLEISQDSLLFQNIIVSDTVESSPYILDLAGGVRYSVRIKANAADPTKDSKFGGNITFKTPTENIFFSISDTDYIDNAAYIRWIAGSKVTHLLVKRDGYDPVKVELTEDEMASGVKYLEGLSGGVTYTIEIYNTDIIKRGTLVFTTKPALVGNVVDLRSVPYRETILYDTLSQISAGSIVILKRGKDYVIPNAYTFDKSVTILSGYSFITDQARIVLQNNFDASGNIDSLKFNDLTIVGSGTNYFMNVSNVTTIGLLSLEKIKTVGVFNNSFVRLKTAGDLVSKLYINNCIFDSIGIASKYALIYANASSSAQYNNIEIQNSTFYSFYYFIRQDGVTTSSVTINNCTFNDMVNQSGYFINFTNFPPVLDVKNCILGRVSDPAASNGIKSTASALDLTGTYMTTDCVFSANPISATAYPNASTDLFTDPDHGDFTIKDNTFAGKSTAGDPRWQIQ